MLDTIELNGFTASVIQDPDPENPREEWDNLGRMMVTDKYSYLGDRNAKQTLLDAIRESKKYQACWETTYGEHYRDFDSMGVLISTAVDVGLIAEYLPLYVYEHSGVMIRTTAFSCQWDSDQAGFIYMFKSEVHREYGVKRISKNLNKKLCEQMKGEVETQDQYCTGQVYGFRVTRKGQVMKSCWGFFDDEYCHSEAEFALKMCVRNHELEKQKRVKALILNKVSLIHRAKFLSYGGF